MASVVPADTAPCVLSDMTSLQLKLSAFCACLMLAGCTSGRMVHPSRALYVIEFQNRASGSVWVTVDVPCNDRWEISQYELLPGAQVRHLADVIGSDQLPSVWLGQHGGARTAVALWDGARRFEDAMQRRRIVVIDNHDPLRIRTELPAQGSVTP